MGTVADETTKFKVGDVVECINGGKYDGGSGWELGLTFTVTKISESSCSRPIYWAGHNNNGVYEDCLKLVNTDSKKHSLTIGDIVTCDTKYSDRFNGEGQIVAIHNDRFHIRILDGRDGGGLLLDNNQRCWRVTFFNGSYLIKVRHSKIEIGLSSQIKKLFNLNDELYDKKTNILGKIVSIYYTDGLPQYSISTYPKCTTNKEINNSNAIKLTTEVKLNYCYKCLLEKINRDTPGTEEENKLIQPGCIVKIRNLEECTRNNFHIGKQYIVVNSDYDSETSNTCMICLNEPIKDYYTIHKSYLKLIKNISNKSTFKVSSLVVRTFNNYKGEKSPILLLGKNKKGVVDVVFQATNMAGCDALATMPVSSFAETLRNIILTKREWVGYAVIYYGSKPKYFTQLAREFIVKDTNFDRFYVCILPNKGIYPYKLIKYDKRIHLLPIKLEIVVE